MTESHTGEGWKVKTENNVIIWDFEQGMELSAFKEEAYPLYEKLIEEKNLKAMVTVVKLDDPFNKEAFQVWEKAAQRAQEAGMEKWAVVAEGITAISLKGKIDVDNLEVLKTEDREEAINWAEK